MTANSWQFNTPASNAYPANGNSYGYQPINLDFLGNQGSGNALGAMGIGSTPMVNDIINNGGTQITPYTQSSAPLSNGAAGGDGGIFGNMLGQGGWGNMAIGGLQTLGGLWQGKQQLDIAKDQLDFQKKAFNKNYAAQRQSTNTQLRDRQKRRAYERPDYYQSVGEYMNKNEVK